MYRLIIFKKIKWFLPLKKVKIKKKVGPCGPDWLATGTSPYNSSIGLRYLLNPPRNAKRSYSKWRHNGYISDSTNFDYTRFWNELGELCLNSLGSLPNCFSFSRIFWFHRLLHSLSGVFWFLGFWAIWNFWTSLGFTGFGDGSSSGSWELHQGNNRSCSRSPCFSGDTGVKASCLAGYSEAAWPILRRSTV